MNYTPHTERDIQHMLNVIGVASTDELFAPVPESLRLNALNLPPGISEMEAMAFVQSLIDCGSETPLSFFRRRCLRSLFAQRGRCHHFTRRIFLQPTRPISPR